MTRVNLLQTDHQPVVFTGHYLGQPAEAYLPWGFYAEGQVHFLRMTIRQLKYPGIQVDRVRKVQDWQVTK